MPNAFELLHPSVQRRLWDMRWTSLRPIQDRAIEHLIGGGGDCIISAPTAGGKTEAAFLPILSRIADDARGGVRAMYVGPLKALINDQFARVEGLCERMEVPVHRWHGDVGEAQRRALLTHPAGVLLITPESLEAMFVRRPTSMPGLFGRLSFVVIDELHAFIGSVRGAQLLSQLDRLRRRCGCDPVRIGLSATLGDPSAACRWLRPGGVPATYIEDAEAERRVAIKLRGIWERPPPLVAQPPAGELDEHDESRTGDEIARGILRACHSATNLVFANAKGSIELLADSMKEQAAAMSLSHEVVVHHGSLSKEAREYAEERLRRDQPCSAVCSNTLEMGIDIGGVDNVIQVSAPWSVASLTQRLGRSGRREGGIAVLRGFFVEQELGAHSRFWDGLHLEFLRGLAMVELMLERFTEPAATNRHHYSTLIHQLLALLAETKGLAAPALYARLTESGAFGPLSPAEFAVLLRSLAARELVGQAPGGDLVLGVRGERMSDHFSFFAAFATPDEFRVLHGTSEIGKLPSDQLPPPTESVILAGRRWTVVEIDAERRQVYVVPSRSRQPPRFRNQGADIHRRVHERMLELASTSAVPSYLDDVAAEFLAEIRDSTRRAGGVHRRIESIGNGETRLFVWGGSRIQRTLCLALRRAELDVRDETVGVDVAATPDTVAAVLRWFIESPDPDLLARLADESFAARLDGDKFDAFVPFALWSRAFIAERLDVEGAQEWCRVMTNA